MATPHRHADHAGFTLVELTIVILILSILAALVVPQISQGSDESRSAATATTVNAVQTKVFEYNAIHGAFPATIDTDWFADNSLPSNPWDPDFAGAPVGYDLTAPVGQTHPAIKHFLGTSVYWYNPSNGRFRALIPYQTDDATSLELYNRCNGVQLADYTATTGG